MQTVQISLYKTKDGSLVTEEVQHPLRSYADLRLRSCNK